MAPQQCYYEAKRKCRVLQRKLFEHQMFEECYYPNFLTFAECKRPGDRCHNMCIDFPSAQPIIPLSSEYCPPHIPPYPCAIGPQVTPCTAEYLPPATPYDKPPAAPCANPYKEIMAEFPEETTELGQPPFAQCLPLLPPTQLTRAIHGIPLVCQNVQTFPKPCPDDMPKYPLYAECPCEEGCAEAAGYSCDQCCPKPSTPPLVGDCGDTLQSYGYSEFSPKCCMKGAAHPLPYARVPQFTPMPTLCTCCGPLPNDLPHTCHRFVFPPKPWRDPFGGRMFFRLNNYNYYQQW